MAACLQKREQLQFLRADFLFGDPRVPEQARCLEIGERHCHSRWLAHGDRDRFVRHDGWHDDLHALASREDGRDDGIFARDILRGKSSGGGRERHERLEVERPLAFPCPAPAPFNADLAGRSEEHTSELQSLMRTSYAVFCLNTNYYTTY